MKEVSLLSALITEASSKLWRFGGGYLFEIDRMLRRLALSGSRLTALRSGSAHMAIGASARLASGSSRVPGAGAASGDDGRKPARSAAPTRADDEFADEDLTAVPRVPAREAAPRAAPRPGSATAWRQPMFAATTSNAAQRAAFTGGPEVAEDMASIQRDVTRVSQLDASASQARASASAYATARPASPGTGAKAGRAPKSITAAARGGAGAVPAGPVDADELFFEGAAGAVASAAGFDEIEDFEDVAGDDDITNLARDLYSETLAPGVAAMPGKRAGAPAASAPARALPKAAAPARGQALRPTQKAAPARPWDAAEHEDATDSDLEANISDFERISRPARFGARIQERSERVRRAEAGASGADSASGSELSGAEDGDDDGFGAVVKETAAALKAAEAASKDDYKVDPVEMQELLEELLEQKVAAAAAAGKPLSDVERAAMRRAAMDLVRNPEWTVDEAAARADDEDEDVDGRISRLHFAGADAAENDPAVQQELALMANMLR